MLKERSAEKNVSQNHYTTVEQILIRKWGRQRFYEILSFGAKGNFAQVEVPKFPIHSDERRPLRLIQGYN